MLIKCIAATTYNTRKLTTVVSIKPESSSLLSNDVGFIVLENQAWLSLREIQDHLGKVAVRPSEPGAGVVFGVVDANALVDEAQVTRILKNHG